MTDKNRQRLEIGLLALVFGMGGGWAAYEMRLGQLEEKVERIDQRVAAIYCSSVPEAQRTACR